MIISLITNQVMHLVTYFWPFEFLHIQFLGPIFLLGCQTHASALVGSLHILELSPLLVVSVAKSFPTLTFLFTLLMVSFEGQNIFILMYSNLSISSFMVSVIFVCCLRNLSLP